MLLEQIKEAFIAQYNVENASAMQAYMKDKFEYIGIKSPERNEIQSEFYEKIKFLTDKKKIHLCEQLWELSPREFQYFAIDILKKYFKKPAADLLETIHYFITTKSWWDTVDSIASNTLGSLIQHNSSLITEMDKWIEDDDFWVRRSALIFQLKYKDTIDEQRLFSYCEKCMHEKEFFIRKAIGWALRQHSRTNSKGVIAFVKKNEQSLSNLSKKEALRLI